MVPPPTPDIIPLCNPPIQPLLPLPNPVILSEAKDPPFPCCTKLPFFLYRTPNPHRPKAPTLVHDPTLIARLRAALPGTAPITEKRMFGGACLMWGDHMLCGASVPRGGAGRFLFRVGPENLSAALAIPGVTRMEMAGRTMKGFVFAEADTVTAPQLAQLLSLARAHVERLPPKQPATKRPAPPRTR